MKKIIFLVSCSILFFSCSRRIDSKQTKKECRARKSYSVMTKHFNEVAVQKKQALANFVNSLSLEEMVCQLFIANLVGDTVFSPIERISDITQNPKDTNFIVPGGYLFFSYNLSDNPEKIMNFTDSIRDFCVENKISPPFISIDQEGGLVNRLKIVSGPLPSQKRVADNLDIQKAYRLYTLQAIQMRSLGFDMNMAPVVEVLTSQNEDFLVGRSFGNVENVTSYSIACVNAYQNQNVGTVLKHFPGNSNTDPHTGLPEIMLSKQELDEQLLPFKICVSKNPSGVLMSHARTSCLDKDLPACLSENWVTGELRKNYGFDGIVFSDDIFMGALNKNGYPPEKAAVMAIEAGVNCIMTSEKRFASNAKILVNRAKDDSAFLEKIKKSCEKIIDFKIKCGIYKFSPKNDKSGFYIEPNQNRKTLHDRIFNFNEARKENIDLYLNNFSAIR